MSKEETMVEREMSPELAAIAAATRAKIRAAFAGCPSYRAMLSKAKEEGNG